MNNPVLKHKDEFKKLLAGYQVGPEGQRILAGTEVVLMVSVTSAGRNTIMRELVKTGKYYFLVSDTTRPPRVNDGVPEEHGVVYWFRSEEEMLDEIKRGMFLEAAVIHEQQVSGISIREIAKARDLQKIAITDIEVVGTETIMQAKPDAKPVFVLPPNFDEWMRRLSDRGNLSEAEIQRRLRSAEMELRRALDDDYFYFVINDRLEDAVADVRAIAERGEYTGAHRAAGLERARRLLDELKAHER